MRASCFCGRIDADGEFGGARQFRDSITGSAADIENAFTGGQARGESVTGNVFVP